MALLLVSGSRDVRVQLVVADSARLYDPSVLVTLENTHSVVFLEQFVETVDVEWEVLVALG